MWPLNLEQLQYLDNVNLEPEITASWQEILLLTSEIEYDEALDVALKDVINIITQEEQKHKLFHRKWVQQNFQAWLSPHDPQQLQGPQRSYIDTSTKKTCIAIWTQLTVDTECKNRHWNCQEEMTLFLLVDSSYQSE